MIYTAIVIQLKTWNALAKNVSKDENKPPNWHGFKRNWQKCWNVWIIVALSLSRLFQKNNKGAIRLEGYWDAMSAPWKSYLFTSDIYNRAECFTCRKFRKFHCKKNMLPIRLSRMTMNADIFFFNFLQKNYRNGKRNLTFRYINRSLILLSYLAEIF